MRIPRRSIIFLLLGALLVTTAGCDPIRKKFTRKKKETKKPPRIYQIKKYEKKPTPELYTKHYTYWVTWQSELIKVLGNNHKKDRRCAEEIVGNLRDMQHILVQEKANQLESHIVALEEVRDTIVNEDLTTANRDYVRRTLEREDRTIKREFCLSKVKEYLKKSFDDDEVPAAAASPSGAAEEPAVAVAAPPTTEASR